MNFSSLRAAVSGGRNRMKSGRYDLDLTYVTDRIIAMGLPCSGIESTFRNRIDEVASFLSLHHSGKFMIINLAEREYDYSLFDHQVLEYGFPDHAAPPLEVIWQCCHSIHSWLLSDKENVIVVHCLAGKGRTGVIVSSYLMFCGHIQNSDPTLRAQEALEFFRSRRGEGVTYNDQRRYVQYFAQMVCKVDGSTAAPQLSDASPSPTVEDEKRADLPSYLAPPMKLQIAADTNYAKTVPLPPTRRLLLRKVLVHGIPAFDVSTEGCCPALQLRTMAQQGTKSKVLFNSAWGTAPVACYSSAKDECFVFSDVETVLEGNVEVRLMHVKPGRGDSESMCRICFHTSFVTAEESEAGMLRIGLSQLDVSKRKVNTARFPMHFEVDFLFTSEEAAPEAVVAVERSHREDDASEPCLISLPEQSGLTQDLGFPKMMGYLTKQGGLRRNWKRRWFVLEEGKLLYYKSKSHSKCIGKIDLASCNRVEPSLCEDTDRENVLRIPEPAKKRCWLLQAENEAEMIKWINGIALTQAVLMSSEGIADDV